jgi:hypothetical protein
VAPPSAAAAPTETPALAAAPAVAPPTAAAKAAAETVTVSGETPAGAPIQIIPPAVAGGFAGGAAGGIAGGTADVARLNALQPIRWRILASGRVERSSSGGASWEPVPIAPPAVITAGSSPAPSICWLAGQGGVVMLTVDGQTFQRVTFPEVVDLTAIQATSAVRATVTTIDGRMLTTTDRGATWR